MPRLYTRNSGSAAAGELLVLEDEQGDSRVEIAPQRGAHVTSFVVRGRELLYLERDTLEAADRNVRGGIPVLFPSPGKLPNDHFQRDGQSGSMKQHGFARNVSWTPRTTRDDTAARVTLQLKSNADTLAQFPWAFAVDLTFTLAGATLTIDVEVTNTGAVDLPFGFGLHPYFAVVDKQRARIDTRATRAFDNVTKTHVPFTGFDLTLPEVDTYLLDHGSSRSALHLADGSRIDVGGSADFRRWVVWTVAGKDYVCLEPWTSALDALNTGEDLTKLRSKGVFLGQVQIAFSAPSGPI